MGDGTTGENRGGPGLYQDHLGHSPNTHTHRGSLWGVKKRALPAEWHQELLAGSGATMEVVLMLALPQHFTSLLPGSRCRDYLFLFPVFSALSHCSPWAEGSRMRLYHWSYSEPPKEGP